MAWEPKYRVGNYDLGGVQWTAVFHFDGYTGSVSTLKGGGSPIKFEFLNGSDDLFDPWHPSQVKVSIKIEDANFVLADELYAVEPMHCYVEIFEGDEASSAGEPYWKGYVDPSQLEEPYDVLPYDIEVTCVDGLSLLETIPFYDTIEDILQDSGEPYNNRTLETTIIRTILGKIGYTEFKEFIDLYEENMGDTVDDSPMDQLKIDVDVFQDMNCDEVMKHLLSKYNAWIRQINGVFCIFRPVSLKDALVYGRWFSTDSISTSISVAPEYFISRRNTHLTTLKQVGGGRKLKQAPANKVRIIFDYGFKRSWIDNWELKADTWYGTGFDFWDIINPATNGILPASDKVVGEDGVAVTKIGATYPALQQVFGALAIAGSDFIVIEFDYAFYNALTSTINGLFATVRISQGSNWVDANGEWQINTEDLASPTVNVVPGFTDWQTIRIESLLLPDNGALTVQLLATTSTSVSALYKNVKFYTTNTKVLSKQVLRKFKERILSGTAQQQGNATFLRLGSRYKTVKYKAEDINIVEHTYTKQNNINGEVLEYEYILGDVPNVSTPPSDADVNLNNVLNQFAGALCVEGSRYSLPDTAAEFVTNHAGSFSDVDVTSAGNVLIFTKKAALAGTDFSAAAQITNVSGNLNGTAETITANSPATPQVTRIALGGGSGSLDLTVEGDTQIMAYYGSSIEDTIDRFILLYGSGGTDVFAPRTIAKEGTDVLAITGESNGASFTFSWTESGITGVESGSTAAVAGVARVDTITLTGNSGQALIQCDGDDDYANVTIVNGVLLPTTLWHKGNNVESSGDSDYRPLLELIGDEIAEQYSRPKDLVQMPIQDTGTGLSGVNMMGRFVDDLNKDESDNDPKKFVATRGGFDERNRRWELDLIELI